MTTVPPLRAVEVIGLGMNPAELSAGALALVQDAQVLAGGARLLEYFPKHPGRRIVLAAPLAKALDAVAKARVEGLSVAVLADGDPLFYGIGKRLLELLGPDALRFHPGISAVQAAASRIGRSLQDTPVVSLHGRSGIGPLLAALARRGEAAVYTDLANSPDRIALVLLEQGMDSARMWVLEDLGSPFEKVRQLTVAQASRETFSALNLVVITLEGQNRPIPVLGRPDEFYRRREWLITKWPVRACSLAALRLRPTDTLWDVGAGCGSVGIEACALLPYGRVYAVERNHDRGEAIRENIRLAGAWQVRLVRGEAPEVLSGLPDPDRIFVGGGFGKGLSLLPVLCGALQPGGRLVANVVLLSGVQRLLEALASMGWHREITQAQASCSTPLAGDLRLRAHNPVFIIAADKPL